MSNAGVRVRFAPSPTGFLHVGGVRTAIFNYLFARHHGGVFILRIEDTDRKRSSEEAVRQILESLQWLGIEIDEGPYFQSERGELYRKHLERLVAEGKAYRCYCPAEELERKRKQAEAEKRTYVYDRTCRNLTPDQWPDDRPYVVRFKMPGPEELPDHFDDLIMGSIPIDPAKMDDWILARSDGSPTYNFCVVVDDADMRISHVIRGNDHVDNTPKQIMLYRAFGYDVPYFAHMPLTHGPDGSKLSKRREKEYLEQGISVSVQQYRELGYLPQALFNYLTRLGWSHGDQELFTKEQLIELFDLDGVGRSAGVMNPDKLRWVNQQYIMQTPNDELARLLVPFLERRGIHATAGERLERIVEQLKPRAKTLVEMAAMAEYFFRPPGSYDEKAKRKWFKPEAAGILEKVSRALEGIEPFTDERIEQEFRKLAESLTQGKLGKLAQPVRLALTGSTASPSLFFIMEILGREECRARIEKAIEIAKEGAD
ncbi:MAG: glutamate--tRNA ligase [Deltaproteobacteria bacterium]|nr:MAG: glutamate--tRNA ligase [Deltaproteobacteria bacterium]